MPPKFVFVRHGEAEHNVAYHTEGVSAFSNPKFKDAQLTEKGKEQARETGRILSSLKIADIWCSPLTRTIQTAEELFEETSANTMYLHDNLLETLGGNHVCNERKAKYELKEKFDGWDMTLLSEMPACWFEREPVASVRQRMTAFLLWSRELYKDLPNDVHVLVVTHKDAIWSLTGKEMANGEYVIVE
jgi:broad specificity phosphatase PhoE